MTEEKELTKVTCELLEKIEEVKNNIKKSMVVGEVNILKGITIFEVVLKEFNPSKLDMEEVIRIEEFTSHYISKKEEEMQRVNPKVHYGINRCFLIIEGYVKTKKLEKQK